jgi:hypothetical protein
VKICRGCSLLKPSGDFYRTAKGGPMHICKECHKGRMKHRRLTNPYVQEYDRQRSKMPERKAHLARNATQWRKDHPDAYKAQTAVGNALRDKRLKKYPCSICGTEKDVHGHHKDYAKLLDVIWLCAKCHHRIHATFPELGGHHEITQ